MAYIFSYSHITTATIPAESWDEAWFAMQSWKGYLQAFPGLLAVRLSARAMENGDVRFHSQTSWEYPEQLAEWRDGHWSMRNLLSSISKPAFDIAEETMEDFS